MKDVQCNATAYCPGDETCCKLESGDWGCCPFANAVCCPDGVHCCPSGYTCTSSGECTPGSQIIKQVKKQPAIQVSMTIGRYGWLAGLLFDLFVTLGYFTRNMCKKLTCKEQIIFKYHKEHFITYTYNSLYCRCCPIFWNTLYYELTFYDDTKPE